MAKSRDAKTSKEFTAADQAVSCRKLTKQSVLAQIANREIPDLLSYDRIIVSISAGKDSQAQLDLVHEYLTVLGIADRLVVAHADLGHIEIEDAISFGPYFTVVKHTLILDPHQDMLSEMERLAGEIAGWKQAFGQAAFLYQQHLKAAGSVAGPRGVKET